MNIFCQNEKLRITLLGRPLSEDLLNSDREKAFDIVNSKGQSTHRFSFKLGDKGQPFYWPHQLTPDIYRFKKAGGLESVQLKCLQWQRLGSHWPEIDSYIPQVRQLDIYWLSSYSELDYFYALNALSVGAVVISEKKMPWGFVEGDDYCLKNCGQAKEPFLSQLIQFSMYYAPIRARVWQKVRENFSLQDLIQQKVVDEAWMKGD